MLYTKVRNNEGRLLSDEAVLKLLSPSLILRIKGMAIQKRSFLRLEAYLTYKFKGEISILDLGCGNGWMSGQLAHQPDLESCWHRFEYDRIGTGILTF